MTAAKTFYSSSYIPHKILWNVHTHSFMLTLYGEVKRTIKYNCKVFFLCVIIIFACINSHATSHPLENEQFFSVLFLIIPEKNGIYVFLSCEAITAVKMKCISRSMTIFSHI